MSYLDSPRLVFSGRFQTDPSTINNDPHHFDTRMFRSNYQLSGRANGSWNPWGSAAWRFFDCTVEAVVYEDGSVCDDPAYDPLVGVPVNDSDQRVEGKLVDLDSEQQGVSEIWGFQVVVGDPGGGVGFRGDFDVAPFADIWTRYPEGGGRFLFRRLLPVYALQRVVGPRTCRVAILRRTHGVVEAVSWKVRQTVIQEATVRFEHEVQRRRLR